MPRQATKLNTTVICAPERFSEIETLMLGAGSGTLTHLDPSQPLPAHSDTGTIVIGPGIDRARQIELIFQQRKMGLATLLFAPEFRHLNNALGMKINGLELVPITNSRTGSFVLGFQRIVDTVIALLATLLILVPATLIIGPIILLTSRGGIFFSTTVIGENGRPFTWRKFRSMRVAGSSDDGKRRNIVTEAIRHGQTDSSHVSTKVVDVSRVTAIGKLIRKTSLDELPQLLNVIGGSMSLVGPRPCLPYEYDEYNEWQRKRLDFKPGITGVWQVYGRSRVNFDEMVFMDVCGRLNRSLLGDAKLLALTIPVALLGKGAE
jgi:lipopolysaccharide/colanic/teichoic acid biosynthesis glycosyltransferase